MTEAIVVQGVGVAMSYVSYTEQFAMYPVVRALISISRIILVTVSRQPYAQNSVTYCRLYYLPLAKRYSWVQ